jgi:hypothetical protein
MIEPKMFHFLDRIGEPVFREPSCAGKQPEEVDLAVFEDLQQLKACLASPPKDGAQPAPLDYAVE